MNNKYFENRKLRAFENDFDSQTLLITKIWDLNEEIYKKFSDVKILLEINSEVGTKKIEKGLLSIAKDLRKIADYLEKKTENKLEEVEIENE